MACTNRQVARNLNPDQSGAGGVIRFSVWDGWELLEEYGSERAVAYLQGATGVIKSWTHNSTLYYYQDKLGSTTHVATGQLLENFHYDLYGKPAENSVHGVVDLYAGERWVSELGLYDLRNRFMSPELGRFLQADPIGQQIAGAKPSAQAAAFFWAGQAPEKFASSELNLYRYCHNDPANLVDPLGLEFTGENTPIERVPYVTLPGAEKYGGTQWGVHVKWAIDRTDGGYVARIDRLDVAIEKRQVATEVRVKGEARPRYRTAKQIEATETHEKHHETQGRSFHDQNQKRIFPDKYDSPDRAKSEAETKLDSDWKKALDHQPRKFWDALQRKESFR